MRTVHRSPRPKWHADPRDQRVAQAEAQVARWMNLLGILARMGEPQASPARAPSRPDLSLVRQQ